MPREHFRATDRDIQMRGELAETVKIHVKERLFKPVIIQLLKLPSHPQCLLVVVSRDRISHELEFRADSLSAGAIGGQIEIIIAGGLKFVTMPAAILHFQSLPGVVLRRFQHKRTGVDRAFPAILDPKSIEGQLRLFCGHIPDAYIEWAVGVDWHMIPPAVISAEILPVLFARQRILTQKERLQS